MKIGRLIGFNLFLLVVLLIGIELTLHALDLIPQGFLPNKAGTQFGRGSYPRWYFEAHPDRGFDIARNASPQPYSFQDATIEVFSNRYGCFDRNRDRDLDGRYVLALGDSFTWSFNEHPKKWTTLLEGRLGMPVLNCGVSHTGQLHQLSKGRQVVGEIGAPPEIVIVGYYENDPRNDRLFPHATVVDGYLADQAVLIDGEVARFSRVDLEKRYAEFRAGELASKNIDRLATSRIGTIKNFLRDYSVFANLLRRILALAYSERLLPWNELLRSIENDRALLELSSWTREMGSQLVVILIPPHDLSRHYYVGISEFLEASEILHFDLSDEFMRADERGEQLYWRHNHHWSAGGEQLAADAIANWLRTNLDMDWEPKP